jgi:geranylgeranyl diphosphate synthase type I
MAAPPGSPSDSPRGAPFPAETEKWASQALERYRDAIAAEMRAVLAERPLKHVAPMRYHLGWEDRRGEAQKGSGGKMLRPTLCLVCCEGVGGDWAQALPAAAGIELLHNFTLIHDDIEDGSPQRHGRETVWKLWGQARAINVGDGMFSLAHLGMLRLAERGVAPNLVVAALGMLDEACLQLCEGQHLDLVFQTEAEISRDEYLGMVESKTAALIAASTGIGAVLGEGPPVAVAALRRFGRLLGLAFQIRDDVLGIWGEVAETGKPAGDDIRDRKKTFPIVFALERVAGADRRALHSLYRAEIMTDGDIERIAAILERSGALDESERAAAAYARDAISELGGLKLDPRCRAQLEGLAVFAARRPR